MHNDHPNTLNAARMGSPLVVGRKNEFYIEVIYPLLLYKSMDDGEVAEIKYDANPIPERRRLGTEHMNTVNLKDINVVKSRRNRMG